MPRVSFLFIISYIITRRCLWQVAACPSGPCSCVSTDSWICTIKIDNAQIDCSQSEVIAQSISVNLDLDDLNIDRKSVFFINIDKCNIIRLKIGTNAIPPNRLIGNLHSLEHLIIHDRPPAPTNRFMDDLDNLISGLDNLKRVKIENLHLPNWSSRILESCPVVDQIELKNMKIENLEHGSFGSCKLLRVLIIRFNNLKKLFVSSFSGLPELQTLLLSSNRLEEIITNGNGWWEVRNLTRLDFSYNSLTKLDSKIFIGLSKLKQLILNHNQIEFIDKAAFEGLLSLTTLNLNNNPKLILFDLLALAPISTTLTSLRIDTKSIQCIDMKAQSNRFHSQIRSAIRNLQDCNQSGKLSSSTAALPRATVLPAESVPFSNLSLIISLTVFVTILVMGLVFFFLYYTTSRKKIRKYKSYASDHMTTNSVNSGKCSTSIEIPLSNYTIESQRYFTTLDIPHHSPLKLLPRCTSDPLLQRI